MNNLIESLFLCISIVQGQENFQLRYNEMKLVHGEQQALEAVTDACVAQIYSAQARTKNGKELLMYIDSENFNSQWMRNW